MEKIIPANCVATEWRTFVGDTLLNLDIENISKTDNFVQIRQKGTTNTFELCYFVIKQQFLELGKKKPFSQKIIKLPFLASKLFN